MDPAGLQPLTSQEYDRHTGNPKLIDAYRYLTDPVAAHYDSRFKLDPPTGPKPHTGVTYFGPSHDLLQFIAHDPGIDLVHRAYDYQRAISRREIPDPDAPLTGAAAEARIAAAGPSVEATYAANKAAYANLTVTDISGVGVAAMLAKSFDAKGSGHANITFISHNNLYSLVLTTSVVPYNEGAYLTLARTVATYIDNGGGPADG